MRISDWSSDVCSSDLGELLEEAPGRARLLFDRPAQFDRSAVNLARLPQIASLSATQEGVTLEVPPGNRLEVERSGTKVVLDVIGSVEASAKESSKKPTKEAAEETGKNSAKEPAKARVVEDLTPRRQTPPSSAAPAAAQPATDRKSTRLNSSH